MDFLLERGGVYSRAERENPHPAGPHSERRRDRCGYHAVLIRYRKHRLYGMPPALQKKGIPKAFLDKVMCELLGGKEISITTFREGDKADTGQRREIKGLGFAEAELLTEFGYPTQRFVLKEGNHEK